MNRHYVIDVPDTTLRMHVVVRNDRTVSHSAYWTDDDASWPGVWAPATRRQFAHLLQRAHSGSWRMVRYAA